MDGTAAPGRGAASERTKPDGGYVPVKAWALLAAWWCYLEKRITLRQFRVWLALHEVAARRRTLERDRKPRFGPEELRGLVGGVGGMHLRRDVSRLNTLGLCSVTAHSIEFMRSPEDLKVGDLSGFFELFEQVENRARTVPVPRRMLRYLAGCSKRVLLATAIGHLLRLVYLRGKLVKSYGRCKASWVANVLGVDLRGVKRARKLLEKLGVLVAQHPEPDGREHVYENRWGKAYVWDLEWEAPRVSEVSEGPRGLSGRELTRSPAVGGGGVVVPDTELPPLSEFSTTKLPPPESDKHPLTGSKNQKPTSGRPPGVCGKKDGRLPKPSIFDIKCYDLDDTERLLGLHRSAAARGLVGESDADRLRFLALAEHARRYGDDPPRLLRSLLERKRFHFITQADEDGALKRLHRLERGEEAPRRCSMHEEEQQERERMELRRLELAEQAGVVLSKRGAEFLAAARRTQREKESGCASAASLLATVMEGIRA